jgi:hypothetical protein
LRGHGIGSNLLKVKVVLERELETWSLKCTKCGLDVHWVGVSASRPDAGTR